jgi:hypothetical protein
MSHFVIIELFKQFMSEGWSTNVSRSKTCEHTKLLKSYVWRVISESDECQELIGERVSRNKKTKRFLQQGVTP